MKSYKNILKAFAAVALAAGFSASANAQLLSNLTNSIYAGWNFGVIDVAQQFTTGSQSEQIGSVQLDMSYTVGTPVLTAAIYSDASGTPGSLVATLSGPASVAAYSLNTYDASDLTVAANTTYWLVLDNISGGANAAYIDGTPSSTVVSTAGWTIGPTMLAYLATPTDFFGIDPSSSLPMFSINAPTTPVPEPGAMALATLGGLGLLLARRRK